MAQLIDKDAVLAEIERRIKVLQNNPYENHKTICHLDSLRQSIYTLEVKEIDYNPIDTDFERNAVQFCFDNALNTTPRIAKTIAKHFFELGLKAQHSSINIPNLDDIFEENGIDPNSKDAKIFKECYYMALEKLKAQKGE